MFFTSVFIWLEGYQYGLIQLIVLDDRLAFFQEILVLSGRGGVPRLVVGGGNSVQLLMSVETVTIESRCFKCRFKHLELRLHHVGYTEQT